MIDTTADVEGLLAALRATLLTSNQAQRDRVLTGIRDLLLNTPPESKAPQPKSVEVTLITTLNRRRELCTTSLAYVAGKNYEDYAHAALNMHRSSLDERYRCSECKDLWDDHAATRNGERGYITFRNDAEDNDCSLWLPPDSPVPMRRWPNRASLIFKDGPVTIDVQEVEVSFGSHNKIPPLPDVDIFVEHQGYKGPYWLSQEPPVFKPWESLT